jgi:hypothetical protein
VSVGSALDSGDRAAQRVLKTLAPENVEA